MSKICIQLTLMLGPLFVLLHTGQAQSILNRNLIVNGGADDGTAGTSATNIVAIPGWTRTGNLTVLPYNLTGLVQLSDPAPKDHSFNYFSGSSGTSSLTQDIDVSSGASLIAAGNIKFTATGFLGNRLGGQGTTAKFQVDFKNAAGQPLSSKLVGPAGYNGIGMSMQQEVGLVPAGTVRVTVTLTFTNPYGTADSLSLIFETLATSIAYNSNLAINGDAEAGPGVPRTSTTAYVPAWSTTDGTSVAPYGGTGWIQTTDSGPADRGTNLFCGPGTMYQDIDVSGGAADIDASKVKYTVSAWLGGLAGQTSPTLTYTFFDWSGNQLAPTATLPLSTHPGSSGLVLQTHTDALPAKTRRVRISLAYAGSVQAADDISFVLTAQAPPAITSLVSASGFGGFAAIAPGTWVEIFGSNLSATTRPWGSADIVNGVAPTGLDDVHVSIGGTPAFLDYISPSQINALVPSSVSTGSVSVTVTNSNGTSAGFPVTVNATEPGLLAPSVFNLNGKQYVVALFSDGATYVLPQGAINGVVSRPAKPGETITLYGIGFGPVNTGAAAGTIVAAANSLVNPLDFRFGTTLAPTPLYQGLAPSAFGLYQFNIVVPSVAADSAMPFAFDLGGVAGSQTLYIAVQN